jgi:hypothetical protein
MQKQDDKQQTQQQMGIKGKESDLKPAALGSNKKPSENAGSATPQKVEMKLAADAKNKSTIKKEEFVPKPLTEEDKRLIERMTAVMEHVAHEDIEEVEEIKDAI